MHTPVSDDHGLLERLARDPVGTFPDVVRALQDDVFSGALRMTGSHADAEDITQEAFLRAFRALTGYEPDRISSIRLRGWIWTIAANLCRNRARNLARRRETLESDPAPRPDQAMGPEQSALTVIGLEELADRVARLPWAQRSAVVLRHVVGLDYAEIGAALKRPLGTVKNDVHRGLARLRSELSPQEAQ